MNTKNLKYYFYGVVLYIFLVTWAYSACYWSMFNIDIFPYVDFWDVVKFPAAKVAFATLLFSGILSFIFFLPTENKQSGKKNINYKKRVKILKIVGFIVVFILMVLAFWGHSKMAPMLLGITVTWFIVMQVIETYFIKSETESPVVRIIVFILAAWYPFIITIHALDEATNILDNKRYDVVFLPALKDEINQGNFKYLGSVGGYIFLMTFDNKHVIVTQYGSKDYLMFERRPQKTKYEKS
jgi:hypothetical protein